MKKQSNRYMNIYIYDINININILCPNTSPNISFVDFPAITRHPLRPLPKEAEPPEWLYRDMDRFRPAPPWWE